MSWSVGNTGTVATVAAEISKQIDSIPAMHEPEQMWKVKAGELIAEALALAPQEHVCVVSAHGSQWTAEGDVVKSSEISIAIRISEPA